MKFAPLAPFASFLALLAISLPAAAEAPDNGWQIDPSHSVAEFSVEHMVISKTRGTFTEINGTVNLNTDKPEQSVVDVEIPIATLDTRNKKRDDHLKSSDFFDAEKFPTMKFKSVRIAQAGKKKGHFNVTGILTIHGVSKNVTLVAQVSEPVKSPWGTTNVGIHATTEIDRRDFGLTWSKRLESGSLVVGNEIAIAIEMEVLKSNAPKKAATPKS